MNYGIKAGAIAGAAVAIDYPRQHSGIAFEDLIQMLNYPSATAVRVIPIAHEPGEENRWPAGVQSIISAPSAHKLEQAHIP